MRPMDGVIALFILLTALEHMIVTPIAGNPTRHI